MYPVFLYQITDIRTEPLFMFLVTATLYFFLRGLQSASIAHPLLAGVSVSLASLTRPVALILIPFLAICYMIRPGIRAKKMTALIFCFLIGVLITLAPWTIRNYIKYGEVILVNNAGGYNFWRGSSKEMYELTTIKDQAAFSTASEQFETDHQRTITREVNESADSPMARSRVWRRRGLENIKDHPELYFRYSLKKAVNYWRLWLNPQEYGKTKALMSALIFVPLYVLGFIGLLGYRKTNPWIFRFIIFYFLLFWVAHIPFQVVIRFRIPVTDPILLVFTGRAVRVFFQNLR